MNRAVIGVGSNIDKHHNVARAQALLAQCTRLTGVSRMVTTKPIGTEAQEDFLNGAFLVETPLDQAQLNRHLKQIEAQLGRNASHTRFGPRPIDLDIVVWNDTVVHPDFAQRDFVKQSVLELLPNLLENEV